MTVEGTTPVVEFSDKLNSYVDQRAHRRDAAQRPRLQRPAEHGARRAARARRRLPVHQHQRPAHHVQQLHDRRHLEQRPLLRRHRLRRDRASSASPPPSCPSDAIQEFTVQQTPGRRVRGQGRRRHQRRDEERHQRVPRLRLLLPPRRLDGRQELLHREGRRRQDPAPEPAVRRHLRRPDRARTRRSSSATTRASASRWARPIARSCPRPTRSPRRAGRIAAAGLRTTPAGREPARFYPDRPRAASSPSTAPATAAPTTSR